MDTRRRLALEQPQLLAQLDATRLSLAWTRTLRLELLQLGRLLRLLHLKCVEEREPAIAFCNSCATLSALVFFFDDVGGGGGGGGGELKNKRKN